MIEHDNRGGQQSWLTLTKVKYRSAKGPPIRLPGKRTRRIQATAGGINASGKRRIAGGRGGQARTDATSDGGGRIAKDITQVVEKTGMSGDWQ